MKSKDSVTSLRMSKIRGKNTTPERNVRSYLHKKGFRFSLHKKDLPGKPDIVLKIQCNYKCQWLFLASSPVWQIQYAKK